MDYYAIGVMWPLIERILLNDGQFRLKEAIQIFVSKNFYLRAFNKLVNDYGIFEIDDENGFIRLTPKFRSSLIASLTRYGETGCACGILMSPPC